MKNPLLLQFLLRRHVNQPVDCFPTFSNSFQLATIKDDLDEVGSQNAHQKHSSWLRRLAARLSWVVPEEKPFEGPVGVGGDEEEDDCGLDLATFGRRTQTVLTRGRRSSAGTGNFLPGMDDEDHEDKKVGFYADEVRSGGGA